MWGEKKTKIVATLSDFRANEEFVRGLFEAGMDVVRINSAHVTEEGAAKIVEAVRRVNPAIPVILDTKGPEIRVTAVADGRPMANLRPAIRSTSTWRRWYAISRSVRGC